MMLIRALSTLVFTVLPTAFASAAEPSQAPANTSYYVEPGTLGTQRESDPPAYVKNVGSLRNNALSWLDAGLEYRLRYEYRDDDLRRLDVTGSDRPLLQRTRVYAGVRNVLDPLRFAVELTDSRESASRYPSDNRDVNELEFIQAYAELYFPTALGRDPRGNARALSIRAGRMAFEALDRRLIARNEWRNTTNNFEGVRAQLGNDDNDWAVEGWSLHPINRLLEDPDKPNRDVQFNAVIAHWRPWSPALTLEPYYFQLKQDASAANAFRERNILAPGLRVYGRLAGNAVNYDVSVMKQHGNDGGQQAGGEAFTAEIGYTWTHLAWRPRLSASYGYASGDRDPDDNRNERFERFFGFARPWSSDDYIIFENVHSPKIKLEFQPLPGIRIDGGYNTFRLASSTDRFSNLLAGSAANRDRSGGSGDDVGSSWDIRVRFRLAPHVQANIGYSSFRLGDFPAARQQSAAGVHVDDSDFTYIELTYRLFE